MNETLYLQSHHFQSSRKAVLQASCGEGSVTTPECCGGRTKAERFAVVCCFWMSEQMASCSLGRDMLSDVEGL